MAETVPQGCLFKPNLGNAELYIFKSSLSSNITLSLPIPMNYTFLYTLKKCWASLRKSVSHFMYEEI